MIVSCPECKTCYKLKTPPDPKKTLRLKCSKCGNEFHFTAPEQMSPTGIVTILVAHDDFRVVNIIKRILGPLQFQIEYVYDGHQAYEFIRTRRPAAAIIDVALPGMFGFELCEKVKNDRELKETKIILVASIYDRTRYKRKPMNLYGADDYLEKHHIPDSLLPKLLQHLSHRVDAGNISRAAAEPVGKELLKDNRDILLDDRAIDRARENIKQFEHDSLSDIPKVSDRAKKLARLIVSDIALYNQEILEQITVDNYEDKLRMDLTDGISHLTKKIPDAAPQAAELIHGAMKELILKTAGAPA